MNVKDLNIDWLKANHKVIHWFGLGFIQIKLCDFTRLHFYTDVLPKTTKHEHKNEEIHNHRYNFTSKILHGSLYNEIYEIDYDVNGNYILTKETCKEHEESDTPPIPCNVRGVFGDELYANETYYMDNNTFHTVWCPPNTITYIHRSGYQKYYADVVHKKGNELTCPFSIKKTEGELFQIVEKIINDVHREL